jgi:uncharacterized tellurite resistance protein B-like protein
MFFRKPSTRPPATSPDRIAERIDQLLRIHLPEGDAETVQIAVALTGLLACVAYADRKYELAEQAHARACLERIPGLSPAGVGAICDTLRDHIAELAQGNMQVHTRQLRDLTAVELRREVLDVLVDLAAADGELSLAETDLLRRTAAAMGLTQNDYLAAQVRHRERLSVLR